MWNYYEQIRLLSREIKESMQKKIVKKEKSEKEKIKEKQEFFRKNGPIMIKVMKPLAKVLMQKNRKIKDVNDKIKFSLPSKDYQKCEIYIPFGLHLMITLDFDKQNFILEIIKYKNFEDKSFTCLKECYLDKDELEVAVEELFLRYIRGNLIKKG